MRVGTYLALRLWCVGLDGRCMVRRVEKTGISGLQCFNPVLPILLCVSHQQDVTGSTYTHTHTTLYREEGNPPPGGELRLPGIDSNLASVTVTMWLCHTLSTVYKVCLYYYIG